MLILIHTKFNNGQFIHTVSSDKRYKDSSQLMLTYDRFTNNQIKYALRRYLAKNNIKPIQSEDNYDILLGGKIKRPRRNKYVENLIIFYKHIITFANSYDFDISTPSQLIIYPNQLPEGTNLRQLSNWFHYINVYCTGPDDIVRKYYEIKSIDGKLVCENISNSIRERTNNIFLIDYNLCDYEFDKRSNDEYVFLLDKLFRVTRVSKNTE